MKVKITPTGESAQVMEFNVSLPCGANASIAPVSTLTVTQRCQNIKWLSKPMKLALCHS